MPKLRHYDHTGTARFVTFNCYCNGKNFRDPEVCRLLISQIDGSGAKHNFRILGYVTMPDHVHLVLLPPDGIKLGLVIGEIKSRMARDHFA